MTFDIDNRKWMLISVTPADRAKLMTLFKVGHSMNLNFLVFKTSMGLSLVSMDTCFTIPSQICGNLLRIYPSLSQKYV